MQLKAILFWIGRSARHQAVRTEKTQIKSRPISAANGNPGSLPVDSFRKAHLAFDVLQVWSSLFKEPMQWVLVKAHITTVLTLQVVHRFAFSFLLVVAICLPAAWAVVGFYTWWDESVDLKWGTSCLLLRFYGLIAFTVHIKLLLSFLINFSLVQKQSSLITAQHLAFSFFNSFSFFLFLSRCFQAVWISWTGHTGRRDSWSAQ